MDFPGPLRHIIPRPPESRPAHRSALGCHGQTADASIGIPEDPGPTPGEPLDVHSCKIAGIKNPCVGRTPGQDLGRRKVRSVAVDCLPNRIVDLHVKVPLPGWCGRILHRSLGGILPSPWGPGMERKPPNPCTDGLQQKVPIVTKGTRTLLGCRTAPLTLLGAHGGTLFEPVCSGLRTAGVPRLYGGTPQLPEQRKEGSRGTAPRRLSSRPSCVALATRRSLKFRRDGRGNAGGNLLRCESGRVDNQVGARDHPVPGGGILRDVVHPPLPAG